jgi:hypothetical protein
MILTVCCVRDSKVDAYFTPFFVQNEQVAIRSISNLVKDPSHNFALNPSDYDLYLLGTYDDSVGKFDLFDSPQHMLKVLDLLGDK